MAEENKAPEGLWDSFAEIYAKEHEKDQLDGSMQLLTAVNASRSTFHIDVGCGSGVSCLALSKLAQPGATIVGLDNSEKMIEGALKRFQRSGFQQNESNSLFAAHEALETRENLLEEFSGVHAKFYVGDAVLMHVPKPDQMLAEAHRVLKPGCRAAFSVVSPNTNSLDWSNPIFGDTSDMTDDPAFDFGKDPEKTTGLLSAAGFRNLNHWEIISVSNFANGTDAFEMLAVDPFTAEKVPADPAEREALKKKTVEYFDAHYGPGKGLLKFSQVLFVAQKD